jgi:hypothetical protein
LNDEVVHGALALVCHDRRVISWVAITAGTSGKIIRDMMVHCAESRFAAVRASHPVVQWLSDNGSIFGAYKTVAFGLALNLEARFTQSKPPSNAWPRPSSKPSSATISGSAGSRMPPLASLPLTAVWRTAIRYTCILGMTAVHRGKKSFSNLSLVGLNGVKSAS